MCPAPSSLPLSPLTSLIPQSICPQDEQEHAMASDPRRRRRRTSPATGSSTTTTGSSCPASDLPVPGHPNLASSLGAQRDGHGRPITERRRPRWLPDARAPPAKDPPASRSPPRHPHLAGDLLQVWPPSKQYAETEAKDDRQLLEEDTSNQSGKLSSFSSGSNAKYCS
uniref:Uncharacterized protein n=1 Tax=Triticum urartu TaxID=4572 RepID=A0A8R7UAI0_TRIUA